MELNHVSGLTTCSQISDKWRSWQACSAGCTSESERASKYAHGPKGESSTLVIAYASITMQMHALSVRERKSSFYHCFLERCWKTSWMMCTPPTPKPERLKSLFWNNRGLFIWKKLFTSFRVMCGRYAHLSQCLSTSSTETGAKPSIGVMCWFCAKFQQTLGAYRIMQVPLFRFAIIITFLVHGPAPKEGRGPLLGPPV